MGGQQRQHIVFGADHRPQQLAIVGKSDEAFQQMGLAEQMFFGVDEGGHIGVSQHPGHPVALPVSQHQKTQNFQLLVLGAAEEYIGHQFLGPGAHFLGDGGRHPGGLFLFRRGVKTPGYRTKRPRFDKYHLMRIT